MRKGTNEGKLGLTPGEMSCRTNGGGGRRVEAMGRRRQVEATGGGDRSR